jgi:hypothetical protein
MPRNAVEVFRMRPATDEEISLRNAALSILHAVGTDRGGVRRFENDKISITTTQRSSSRVLTVGAEVGKKWGCVFVIYWGLGEPETLVCVRDGAGWEAELRRISAVSTSPKYGQRSVASVASIKRRDAPTAEQVASLTDGDNAEAWARYEGAFRS